MGFMLEYLYQLCKIFYFHMDKLLQLYGQANTIQGPNLPKWIIWLNIVKVNSCEMSLLYSSHHLTKCGAYYNKLNKPNL